MHQSHMGCCSKSRFPHSGDPSQCRGDSVGLETGLITSTLHAPNNFETKLHLEKCRPGFSPKFPWVPSTPPLQPEWFHFHLYFMSGFFLCFRFLLKEVRSVLMQIQTQSYKWTGLGTSPISNGRAQERRRSGDGGDRSSLAAPPRGATENPSDTVDALMLGLPQVGVGGTEGTWGIGIRQVILPTG